MFVQRNRVWERLKDSNVMYSYFVIWVNEVDDYDTKIEISGKSDS